MNYKYWFLIAHSHKSRKLQGDLEEKIQVKIFGENQQWKSTWVQIRITTGFQCRNRVVFSRLSAPEKVEENQIRPWSNEVSLLFRRNSFEGRGSSKLRFFWHSGIIRIPAQRTKLVKIYLISPTKRETFTLALWIKISSQRLWWTMIWKIGKTSKIIEFRWLLRTIEVPLQVTKSMPFQTKTALQLLVFLLRP